MSAMYSPGIVDLIDERWESYDYNRDDVVSMIARIVSPSYSGGNVTNPPTESEKAVAEALLAACD